LRRAQCTIRRLEEGCSLPALGEHNDHVYKALLGMSDCEIGMLKDKGVI
jgi:crotonobetainyl-CoA:carnitine CoA-transferase CaiB-like acyl-CoA transferase